MLQAALTDAKECQARGDYAGARLCLEPFWYRIGERPRVDGLPDEERAEVLLRAGAVAGFIGHEKQVQGAQEFARDLLSESARLSREDERRGEALNHLALTYWRTGEYQQALIILADARRLALDTEGQALNLMNTALLEWRCGNSGRAFALFDSARPFVELLSSPYMMGLWHNGIGSVYGAGPQALHHFAAAADYFERAGHAKYEARARNNAGYMLFTMERFADARAFLNQAREIFSALGSLGDVAQVDDTLARCCLLEGCLAEARRFADEAVELLEQGDEGALLEDAKLTRALVMSEVNRYGL